MSLGWSKTADYPSQPAELVSSNTTVSSVYPRAAHLTGFPTDHKSTLTLRDLSTENDINFVIFRPEADTPQVTVCDVVIMTSVKVQRYRGSPVLSLITHRNTSIRVYTASKIPEPPQSAQVALTPALKRDSHKPGAEEHAYVSYLHRNLDKDTLPDEREFQERAIQSLNVKNKFSLLKDVQEGKFYDLVVRVVREPYNNFDPVTLYVSDYTENPLFHRQTWQGPADPTSGGGDPYGYTSGSADMPKTEWLGPYGKMSIQITCYEPHSSFIRDEVRAEQWVALRNVQIKFGRDAQFLEGFMREERNAAATKINVQVLDTSDRDTIDPNLKEAIRRYRDYTKKKKKQLKEIEAAQEIGLKRRASANLEQGKPNTKERRKRVRAAQEEKERGEEKHINQERCLGLNDQVTCETHNAPCSTIQSILEPVMYETTINNQTTTLALPFTCAKYVARARVVDFFPASLEDFSCTRRLTDFDVLSDNEDDIDSANSLSDDGEAPNTHCVWEWRFALQLEDPAPPSETEDSQPRPRVWVFVDNSEAQCLTGLDATDLRRDPETLSQLRERMFTLWGNLEEHKTHAAERGKQKQQAAADKTKKHGLGLRPPLESSDAEDENEPKEQAVSNKPFVCCIQQYGIRQDEGGEGEVGKWVRCFGLFGTKIYC